ncbi:esterase [Kaistia algarum]|uniref:alpha/beta fold hydrolase n=1 Tax=Kaistia algarum TaxID=2083279 RepID=UPI000CE92C68|nr:alpha/beta hydrolase [Kaistia algarum]MCX5515755.1 alpha/beta hydrolase [Kaistia algarum]PPE80870.1 esterase [Kaistia algarum]
MSRPSFLLLHGAWAGRWVWDAVAPLLGAAGHAVVAPDLPGRPPWADGDGVTVNDMVDHALVALGGTEGPWIVVGHSGGGIVATMVAERLAARQPGSAAGLVYLAGMMLPSGMGFPEACTLAGAPSPQGIEPFLQPTADGLGTFVPPEAAEDIFFQCADPVYARAAAARLNAQRNTSWMIAPRWTAEGAGTVPRLYVEALQDRSVPIAVQRTMQRLVPGARIATLDTDHAPQLSCPDCVAEILLDFARGHSD